MLHLDLQVVSQALNWAKEGEPIWLCTVLSTFGSSPREPGSMMVARADGRHLGSLSGGCVEEDFLEKLGEGFYREPVQQVRYGDTTPGANSEKAQMSSIRLPCGGILDVLVEYLTPCPDVVDHLSTMVEILQGHHSQQRIVNTVTGERRFSSDISTAPRIVLEENAVAILVGPSTRLIIAGISTVAVECARFAQALGYEVIVCDHREQERMDFEVAGVKVEDVMPALFIAKPGNCHGATAIVAMTHDPRIDDLAMMEAVNTDAFYIGVMGSRKTSAARAERLARIGELAEDEIARINMPIGLALGSKTPAEIALAVMADIVRVHKGRPRDQL